jgi:hypothetical protein
VRVDDRGKRKFHRPLVEERIQRLGIDADDGPPIFRECVFCERNAMHWWAHAMVALVRGGQVKVERLRLVEQGEIEQLDIAARAVVGDVPLKMSEIRRLRLKRQARYGGAPRHGYHRQADLRADIDIGSTLVALEELDECPVLGRRPRFCLGIAAQDAGVVDGALDQPISPVYFKTRHPAASRQRPECVVIEIGRECSEQPLAHAVRQFHRGCCQLPMQPALGSRR